MATKYLIFVVAFDFTAFALGSPYFENFPQTNHVVGRAVARAAIRPQPQNWYPGQGLYIRTENGSTVTYHACQTRFFPNERNCAEAYVQGREGEVNILSEVGTTTSIPPPQDFTTHLPLLPPSQISPTYPPSPYTPPTPSPSNNFHSAHFQSYNLSPSHLPPNPATPSPHDFHPTPSPQPPHIHVSPAQSKPSYYPAAHSSPPLYNQSPPPNRRHANPVQQFQSEQPSEGSFSQQPTHNRQGKSQRKRNKAGRNTIVREERRVVNNPGMSHAQQENFQDKYIFENWRYYPTTRRFQFVGIVDRKEYDESIQRGHDADRNTNVPLDCFRYCLQTQGQIKQCSRDICNPLRV